MIVVVAWNCRRQWKMKTKNNREKRKKLKNQRNARINCTISFSYFVHYKLKWRMVQAVNQIFRRELRSNLTDHPIRQFFAAITNCGCQLNTTVPMMMSMARDLFYGTNSMRSSFLFVYVFHRNRPSTNVYRPKAWTIGGGVEHTKD